MAVRPCTYTYSFPARRPSPSSPNPPFHQSTPAKDDLNQKTGSLLYNATYLNDPTKRTRAVLAGNFSAYNGVTVGA